MILACGAWFLILYLLSTRTWLLKAADGSRVQAEDGAAGEELKEGGISMDIRTLHRRCVILRKAMGRTQTQFLVIHPDTTYQVPTVCWTPELLLGTQ